MDGATAGSTQAKPSLHAKRSSSVIVHRVRPEAGEQFLKLQDDFAAAAKAFAGYQSTDVFPPENPEKDPWVVLVHFDTPAEMNVWIESPARLQLVEKLNREIGKFELRVLPEGFAPWFAGLTQKPPPGWKMAMTVVFALFPTVMFLAILTGKITAPLGFSFGMLVGNIMSVSALQWGIMPYLTAALQPWYGAKGGKSVLGAIIIAGALVLMAAGFRLYFRS